MKLALGLVLVGAIVATLLVVERYASQSPLFVQPSDAIARAWNESRTEKACTASSATAVESGLLNAKPGDHIVCDDRLNGADYLDEPPTMPDGYHAVFVPTACPACPVGWVFIKGTTCGPDEFNCASWTR